MKEPPRVTVVSARDVVRLAAVTAPVAFTSTSVPDGLPALSVSILILRFAAGEENFLRESLRVDALTPEPNAGKDTLVFAVVLLMSFTDVACANVATVST